jgi:hypothetical protein
MAVRRVARSGKVNYRRQLIPLKVKNSIERLHPNAPILRHSSASAEGYRSGRDSDTGQPQRPEAIGVIDQKTVHHQRDEYAEVEK